MRNPGKTPPFRGPRGEILPGSIAETHYLRLGGVDQWVMIRGESVSNPPLVMLHGGPGWSETGFFRGCNAVLEKSFTVVYWDQRGAGRSSHRSIPRASLTVAQHLADLDELVAWVLARTRAEQVAIFGHSWGSALGVLYAARFPAKVAAYVGSGQLGDWAAAERASYALALAEAQRRRARTAEKKLRAIGPPPYDASKVFVERTVVSRLGGVMSAKGIWHVARILHGAPEVSLLALPKAWRAFYSTFQAMWPEVSQLNLLEAAPELRMPVFFFLGRRDDFVPPETSVAYFDALVAPSKQIVWFEKSGHEPFVDEAERFNAAMVDIVRPVLWQRHGHDPPRSVTPAMAEHITA
jgi:pimeloyl-ACP methyl ester carboxylesterase